MIAKRNIRLCTKDCLCLYVCPTGATDTEDGQIDPNKCLDGCRLCVDACTSHAISLVPEVFPPQQKKQLDVVNSLRAIAQSKIDQAAIADSISVNAESPVDGQFAKTIAASNRLMAEDLLREAGFMLPQSDKVKGLLESLLEEASGDDFPRASVELLLDIL